MDGPKYLLWCDLETTGLNPKEDSILEIALVLTDSELNEIGRYSHIFCPRLDFSKITDHVKEMHTKNGLWADVISLGSEGLGISVLNWLQEIFPTKPNYQGSGKIIDLDKNDVYLAGSSVHFDRSFLDETFYFHRNLSHRVFDVSVLRTMIKMWKPELLWQQNDTHRAMDDILDHIEEAKYYRKVLGLGN